VGQPLSTNTLDHTLFIVIDIVTGGGRCGGSTTCKQSLQFVNRQTAETELGKLHDLIGVGLSITSKETQFLIDAAMIAFHRLRRIGNILIRGQQIGIAGCNIELLNASLLHLLVGCQLSRRLTL